jgi:hypothetical protein
MLALLKIMGKSGVISLGNMPLAYWIGDPMFLIGSRINYTIKLDFVKFEFDLLKN